MSNDLNDELLGSPLSHKNSYLSRRRRSSMFDPIDPSEIEKRMYNSLEITKLCDDDSLKIPILIEAKANLARSIECDRLKIEKIKLSGLSEYDDIQVKFTIFPSKITQSTKNYSRCIIDESVQFNMEHLSIEIRVLEFKLISKDKCLGYARVPFKEIHSETIISKELYQSFKIEDMDYNGELLFSLGYLPSAERLTLVILKGRNLKFIGHDNKSLPNVFIKASLWINNGERIKKRKTCTKRSTMNPLFNEEIIFSDIKKEKLIDMSLILEAYHESIKSRSLLGSIKLSILSQGIEYEHWKLVAKGKKSAAIWHKLNLPKNNSLNSSIKINSPSDECKQKLSNFSIKKLFNLSNNGHK